MKLAHPQLANSLQRAYSGEMAASLAYIGHAGSLRNAEERAKVKEIENDEWNHRAAVLRIMQQYEIPISRFYEIKFYLIGRFIGFSCYFIGRFMPYFFAGKLESGNVCEYFVMIQQFRSLGITEHDEVLYEMGLREKEHEVHFLEVIKDAKWLPWFERIFAWGRDLSKNDVSLEKPLPLSEAGEYCKHYKRENPSSGS